MERQEALLFQEKINSGLIDPDAPQSFVLDPSVLTIKDFQVCMIFFFLDLFCRNASY